MHPCEGISLGWSVAFGGVVALDKGRHCIWWKAGVAFDEGVAFDNYAALMGRIFIGRRQAGVALLLRKAFHSGEKMRFLFGEGIAFG